MSLHTSKTTSASTPAVSFNDDRDTGLHSSAANTISLVAGGTETVTSTGALTTLGPGGGVSLSSVYGIPQTYRFDFSSASNQTGVITGGSLANPFGTTVIITRAIYRASTASTGACTLDIGLAADATTSADTTFDGLNANATAGTVSDSMNATTAGTNGLVKAQPWSATQCFNVAEASGDSTGLVASVWLTIQKLT